MPEFVWRAADSSGKMVEGRSAAASAMAVMGQLRGRGLTPVQMALAFRYCNWRVASTIIGVRSLAQLDENLDAWGTQLSPELLAEIDAIRWELRDPAQ